MRNLRLWLLAGALMVVASPALPALAGSESDGAACKISLVCPFPTDAEADRVIVVLEKITKSLAERNYDEMQQYIDEGCTTYDATTKRTVIGRQAIIADVKEKMAAEEAKLKAPITGYKIDRPYAKVNGDTAVVCFILIKELGGEHPQKFEEHCTDVFVKHGQDWLKLNFRGDGWKRLGSNASPK